MVRPAGQKVQKRPWTQKKNPLVNKAILFRLNPYAKTLRRKELRKFKFLPASVLQPILLPSSETGTHQGNERQEAQATCCCEQGFPRQPLCSLISVALQRCTFRNVLIWFTAVAWEYDFYCVIDLFYAPHAEPKMSCCSFFHSRTKQWHFPCLM